MDRYDREWNRGYGGPPPRSAYDRDVRHGGGWMGRGGRGGWPFDEGRGGGGYGGGWASGGWGGPSGGGYGGWGGRSGGGYGASGYDRFGGGYGGSGYDRFGGGYGGSGYDRFGGGGWQGGGGAYGGGGEFSTYRRGRYDGPPPPSMGEPGTRYDGIGDRSFYDEPFGRFRSPGFREFADGYYEDLDPDFDEFDDDPDALGDFEAAWGTEPDDGELQRRVWQSLRQDGFVDAESIKVEVKDQVVTLRGEVGDYMEARYAWDDAWEAPGVRGVISNLAIRGESRQEAPPDAARKAASGTKRESGGRSPQK